MDRVSQSMPLSHLQTSGSCNRSLEHPPASPPSSTGKEYFFTALGPSNVKAPASPLATAGSQNAFPVCMKRLEDALVSAARCCGEAAALEPSTSAAPLNLDLDVKELLNAHLGMSVPPERLSVPCQGCLNLKHQLQEKLALKVSSDISEAYSSTEKNFLTLTAYQTEKALCPAFKIKSVAQLATYAAEYLDSWSREGQVLGGRGNSFFVFSSMSVFV